MPNSDFWKQPTISIAQAFGAITIMFIGFEFYYNSDRTTNDFSNFKKEEGLYRKGQDEVNNEQKSLAYSQARMAKESVNERLDRKVDPLEKDVEELKEWMWYRKGVIDTEKRLSK